MWPDEISAQFERYFKVVYLQEHPNTYAVGPNHRLDQRFEDLARTSPDTPRIFFLNSWTKCDSLLGLDRIHAPKVAYLHDSHFDLESFDWDLAQGFSHVLLENQISVDYHVRRGARNVVTWCPLYFKGTRAEARQYLPSTTRPLDVVFVGNTKEQIHPGRVDFLRALERRLGDRVRCFFGPGNLREIYPRAKIVINESWRPQTGSTDAAYGVNFRVFEAMACGAFLLTDSPSPSMSVLFKEGGHFASFRHGDAEDAADRIQYYLSAEGERVRMATAGWEETCRLHTVDARADSLVPLLEELAEKGMGVPAMPQGHTLPPIADVLSAEKVENTAGLTSARVSFHLGRALLRSLLAWRQQGASERNFYFVERLEEAHRLLRDALRSPEWAGAATALLPVIRFALGDRQGAIAEWTSLMDSPPSAPYCGMILGVLLDRVDAVGRNATLKRLSQLATTRLSNEESRILAEIACRAFYAEAA